MPKLLESAAKIVFIMIAATACISLFTGRLQEDSFMILASGTFAFFFANKGDSSKEYLGK